MTKTLAILSKGFTQFNFFTEDLTLYLALKVSKSSTLENSEALKCFAFSIMSRFWV